MAEEEDDDLAATLNAESMRVCANTTLLLHVVCGLGVHHAMPLQTIIATWLVRCTLWCALTLFFLPPVGCCYTA